jgi:DsbC/DsbD-like thiol-disulfide interchange protein
MNVTLLVALALSVAKGGPSPPTVSVRVPEAVKLVYGELVETQVSITVAEGYHLQANPASEDYLVPTRLDLKTPAGVTVSKITYPPGKPYRLNGANNDLKTYDGNFEIGLLLKASRVARPGKHVLEGRLHYQACDSRTCLFPTSVSLTLTVNVVATHQKAKQARGGKP